MRYHPENFRKNSFVLFGKQIFIAAMAGPHNNSFHGSKGDEQGIIWSLNYLKKAGIDVLIGLHEEKNFKEEAEAAGLVYHFLFIEDYMEMSSSLHRPISADYYDKIYTIIEQASRVGKKVCIHCGSGNGRTGTALAALKLREFIERKALQHSAILNEVAEKNIILHEYAPAEEIFSTDAVLNENNPEYTLIVTPFVAQAIKAIRWEYHAPEDNVSARGSVETQNDADTLVNYEQHLKKRISKERRKKVVVPLSDPPSSKLEEVKESLEPVPKFIKQAMHYTGFAPDIFADCLFAGSHPAWEGENAARNLFLLKNLGIKKIVSLEKQHSNEITFLWLSLGRDLIHETEDKDMCYFISDGNVPSLEMLDAISASILASISSNKKIYLHCASGLGRTGTVLAAVYMKTLDSSAEEAIAFVRGHYNNLAIESQAQEQLLSSYFQWLHQTPEAQFVEAEPSWQETEETVLKKAFLMAYNKRLAFERNSLFFGGLRTGEVLEHWSLSQILEHALKHPSSRSRLVCEEQGWLVEKGGVQTKAPLTIKKIVGALMSQNLASERQCALM